MAQVRVLRFLEYIYSDADAAHRDMENWGVGANATYRPSRGSTHGVTIRSATMLPSPVIPVELSARQEAIELAESVKRLALGVEWDEQADRLIDQLKAQDADQ